MPIKDGVIHWTGHNCFEIEISPQMRKSKINSITGYDEGFLTIEFTDRSWVTIPYPNNLADLTKEIESGLHLQLNSGISCRLPQSKRDNDSALLFFGYLYES